MYENVDAIPWEYSFLEGGLQRGFILVLTNEAFIKVSCQTLNVLQ